MSSILILLDALPQIGTSPIYHSLVALDTSQNRSTALFGWPSWVYKAKSTKDDRYYCLRRLEGKTNLTKSIWISIDHR